MGSKVGVRGTSQNGFGGCTSCFCDASAEDGGDPGEFAPRVRRLDKQDMVAALVRGN